MQAHSIKWILSTFRTRLVPAKLLNNKMADVKRVARRRAVVKGVS